MLLCKKLKKMTIISDIKKFIADNKLSDEDIKAKWLTKPDTKDQTDAAKSDGEQSDVDSDEQDESGEEEAPEKEKQPDIRSMIHEILAEELQLMKKGKPATKPKTEKKIAPVKHYSQEFGAIK